MSVEVMIIADDLTGANDSGVQFARRGLTTSVLLKLDEHALSGQGCIVLNTDSRSVPSDQAYERVAQAAMSLKHYQATWIYKKIDSTLRGNIGVELDAMYDVFQPDFLIIAPAYPDNGRTTLDGIHYLHGKPVHLTEIGADQITPVTESYIPTLLAQQTKKQTAVITYKQLRAGNQIIVNRLEEIHSADIRYVVSDAEREEDLMALVQAVSHSGYRVVWAGSAGLAKILPISGSPSVDTVGITNISSHNAVSLPLPLPLPFPVLVAIGSITSRSYTQLRSLLATKNTKGIRLNTERLVLEPADREQEILRVLALGATAVMSGLDVVIHVPMEDDAVSRTAVIGQAEGNNSIPASECIADAMGEVVSRLLTAARWTGIVMTGGDTATHICHKLEADRFELIDEVEPGVPIGMLIGEIRLKAVTKAGSFGTDEVLQKSIARLKEHS